MGPVEIICGILLILSSLIIIIVVLLQESKNEGGLASAIGGGSNESFFGKNGGRTRDAKLNRFTKVAAIVFFVVTLVANIVSQVVK